MRKNLFHNKTNLIRKYYIFSLSLTISLSLALTLPLILYLPHSLFLTLSRSLSRTHIFYGTSSSRRPFSKLKQNERKLYALFYPIHFCQISARFYYILKYTMTNGGHIKRRRVEPSREIKATQRFCLR